MPVQNGIYPQPHTSRAVEVKKLIQRPEGEEKAQNTRAHYRLTPSLVTGRVLSPGVLHLCSGVKALAGSQEQVSAYPLPCPLRPSSRPNRDLEGPCTWGWGFPESLHLVKQCGCPPSFSGQKKPDPRMYRLSVLPRVSAEVSAPCPPAPEHWEPEERA